jgi:predicted DNA-binding ribbon-helix-helix protein
MAAVKQKSKRTSGRYVTIYLDRALYRQFQREALARKLTVGKIVKERLLEQEKNELSIYDRVRHLIGEIDGPADLSTNPKYLKEFGEDTRPV